MLQRTYDMTARQRFQQQQEHMPMQQPMQHQFCAWQCVLLLYTFQTVKRSRIVTLDADMR